MSKPQASPGSEPVPRRGLVRAANSCAKYMWTGLRLYGQACAHTMWFPPSGATGGQEADAEAFPRPALDLAGQDSAGQAAIGRDPAARPAAVPFPAGRASTAPLGATRAR